jgi:hypothetical protein
VTGELCEVEQVEMFRRPVRSQAVHLPPRLLEPDRKGSVIQDVLGSMRARWAERRGPPAFGRDGRASVGSVSLSGRQAKTRGD